MKLTVKEKEVLEIVRNITHENIEKINSILLGLMTYGLLNYTDKESIVIPYFGTFFIKYKGDQITPDGKEAVLESYFEPSPYLRENIGAYEDLKKNSFVDIETVPIFKHLFDLNERTLKMTLNDTGIKDEE